jgi:hypothetical protein
MNSKYHVTLHSIEEIQELPNGWTNDHYRTLLELADFDGYADIDESELKDYAILALQDMDVEDAAMLVLQYRFAEQFTKGQIQNLAFELMNDKLWEEYQDISKHEEMYHCTVLLKAAFPRKFPETDAVKLIFEVQPTDTNGREALAQPSKTLLTRLLAHDMDSHAVLKRLFSGSLAGGSFPEANHIIWQFASTQLENSIQFTVYSSWYWFKPMEEVSSFTASVPIDVRAK